MFLTLIESLHKGLKYTFFGQLTWVVLSNAQPPLLTGTLNPIYVPLSYS
jgi:hypothetical protein